MNSILKKVYLVLFFTAVPSLAQSTFAQNQCNQISEENTKFVQFTFRQFERECSTMIFQAIGTDAVSCSYPREWIGSPERRLEQRVRRDLTTCDIVWETRQTSAPQWEVVMRKPENGNAV